MGNPVRKEAQSERAEGIEAPSKFSNRLHHPKAKIQDYAPIVGRSTIEELGALARGCQEKLYKT